MSDGWATGGSSHPFLDDLISSSSVGRDGGWARARNRSHARRPALGSTGHPHLDQLMEWGRDEYANPAYVDAVLRNFSRLGLREVYAVVDFGEGRQGEDALLRRLETHWKLLMGYPLPDLTYPEACRRASGLVLGRLQGGGRARCRRLVEALVAPFSEVRLRLSRRRLSRRCPTGDWDYDAETLGLPRAPVTRTLLRLCFMPPLVFGGGLVRLGVDETPEIPAGPFDTDLILLDLADGPSREQWFEGAPDASPPEALLALLGTLAGEGA